MSSPIEIPDLEPVTIINPNADFVLVRQGLSDRKATVSQISNIAFSEYPISSTPLNATDLFIIGKNTGLGTYQNYAITPERIGFLAGTKMWFYQATAPNGWQIIPDSGDRVLGTVLSGGATYQYNNVGLMGSWQQQDVDGVIGKGLNINQMPLHSHAIKVKSSSGFNSNSTVSGAGSSGNTKFIGAIDAIEPIQKTGNNLGTDQTSLGHNHGNKWRPAGAIGILCQKID